MSTHTNIEYAPSAHRAKSPLEQVFNQVRFEILLTLRRGENILITLIMPLLFLVFFTSLNLIPATKGKNSIDLLLPGILSLAILAAGMVNLGIATAYERYYGVLKRLGSSPLSRGGLITAKVISILILEVIQVILLIGVASIFYGWRPAGSFPLALLAIILGTITFSALGLAMAGALRAETTLALANILYVIFLLIGGGIVPLERLPGPLSALSQLLPAAALAQALQSTMTANGSFPGFALLVLTIWAIIILFVAIRTFKWE